MSKERKNMKGTYFISSISLTSYSVEYGIVSIFTLFMLFFMNFSIPLTSTVYSYYYGFVYLLPILIGYISDKYVDESTALTIGYVSMIISQILLCVTALLHQNGGIELDSIVFNIQSIVLFIGLFFLALGTSFTNISFSHIINSINNDHDSRFVGFSIYYPFINLGILIGVCIMSVIIGEENYGLYSLAFAIFAFILVIGFVCFKLFKGKYLVDNYGNPMEENHSKCSIRDLANKILNASSYKSISKIKNLNLIKRIDSFKNSLNSHEKDRLLVFFIFLLIIIVYRIVFAQTNLSMVFFIDSFVQRDFGSFVIPVQLYFILNPIFILILGPIFFKINNKLTEMGKDFYTINMLIISLLIMGFCYMILCALGFYIDIGTLDKVNLLWIILFDFLLAISELHFSIPAYSMVGKLNPEKYYSLFFGIFTATRSVAMFIAGIISSYFPENPPIFIYNIPFNGLMNFFSIFVIMTIIAAMVLIIFKKNLTAKMHREDFNQS